MSESAKRVLHVVTFMGMGGLETMLMNYYRNINREKLQFDFLVHRDFKAYYDDEIEQLGGKIYRLPQLSPFSATYLKKLDSFFSEHNEYKIVHSHLDCMSGIPLKYAKKNGVPVRIAHAHSSNQTKDYKYPLKLIYKRNINKYATLFFACGKMAGEWMFSGEEFEILPNAIDSKRFSFSEEYRSDIRKSFGLDSNAIVIGHVGRFSQPKNHSFLIDVFKAYHDMNGNSFLMLVGDGGLAKEIKEKVKSLGLDNNVIFTGVRKDVSDLLQAFDVFCFPSLYEGLGIAVVEAQAAGLPCIISDKVPIESAVVDGLVKQIPLSESAECWAKAIEEIANTPRKNTYDQICKAGFDIKVKASELEKFYLDKYDDLERK